MSMFSALNFLNLKTTHRNRFSPLNYFLSFHANYVGNKNLKIRKSNNQKIQPFYLIP